MRACGVTEVDGQVTSLALPSPPQPGRGQVLIAVQAAGVGPWDRLLHTGGWDVGLRPPAALGVEGAGRILALGDGVSRLAVNERVLVHDAPLPGGSGFWAEQVLATAAHVAHCSDGLDMVDAGALPVSGLTARQALDALALAPGDSVLITGGAGATGALAIQLAVRAGLKVTTTASGPHMDRLLGLGATQVLDYRDPDWPKQVAGRFSGALIAASGTASAAQALVHDNGRLCSLTSDAPLGERGISTQNLYVQPNAGQLAALAAMALEGTLVQAVDSSPLSQGTEAYERVTSGRGSGKKVVLRP